MQDLLYKYRKIIIASVTILFIGVIGISIYYIIWNNINSAYVNVTVLPSMAEVKVGEKDCPTYGECRMAPGEYEVEISCDGFISKKFSLLVEEGYAEGNFISLYLEPEEWNADWYEKNLNDTENMIMGAIVYQEANSELEELKEENSALEVLPLRVDYYTQNSSKRVRYTIDYQLNKDSTGFVIVIIDYTGGNYENALEKLKARAIDVDKYEIDYSDISSEFEWGHAG